MSAPSVDIWWTTGAAAEPVTARRLAGGHSAVPSEWQRGLRGRFLADVTRRNQAKAPSWSARGAALGWRFNLSSGRHLSLTDSGPYLIVAVGHGVPLGIDAERIRSVDNCLSTLSNLGLRAHVRALRRMAPAARNRAFAHIWTAFEAFLKLERLPWDAAAARFSAHQEQWFFTTDGAALFAGEARLGLAFKPIYSIPNILLTVATPVPCDVTATAWGCGRRAISAGKTSKRGLG